MINNQRRFKEEGGKEFINNKIRELMNGKAH